MVAGIVCFLPAIVVWLVTSTPNAAVIGGNDLGGDVDVRSVLLPGIAQHAPFDDLYCGAEVPRLCEAREDGLDLLGGGIEGDVRCPGLSGWNLRQGGV